MDEAEWVSCRDPARMLAFLRLRNADDRKVRLFVCACWRPRVRVVVEPDALLQDIEAVEEGRHQDRPVRFFPTYPDPWDAAIKSSRVGIEVTGKRDPEPGLTADQQSAVLRDIFGNPFRPTPARPEWFTSAAVRIARGAYSERMFDVLPILADALEDAGCDNGDVLTHCRGPGPHVRGCWVVDLIMGGGGDPASPGGRTSCTPRS